MSSGHLTAAILGPLVVGLASCDRGDEAELQRQIDALSGRVQALEAKQRELSAASSSTPTRAFLLTTTWIAFGQPAQTTQTRVPYEEACNHAREAALGEGQRLRDQADARIEAARQRGGMVNPVVPQVTAFCAPAA